MKTLLFGFVLAFLAFTSASAQESKTTMESATIVTTVTGTAAQLTWKKGAENVAYFIVERSTNGVDFTQCAIVFTGEDASLVDYKFRDKIAANTHGLVYRIGLVNEQKRLRYLPAKTLISPESL